MKKLFFALTYILFLFLVGCEDTTEQLPQIGYAESYDQAAEIYLQQAAKSSAPAKQAYQLDAVGRLLLDGDITEAQQVLATINTKQLSPAQLNEKYLLSARLYLLQNQPELALGQLNLIPNVSTLVDNIQIAYYQLYAEADLDLGNKLASAEDRINLDRLLFGAAQNANRIMIWHLLQQVSVTNLNDQLSYTTDTTTKGWLALASIMQTNKINTSAFNNAITTWLQTYPDHPAKMFIPTIKTSPTSSNDLVNSSMQIGLLLPQSGNLSQASSTIRSGMMAAYYQNSSTNRPTINLYNANNSVSAYQQAVQAGSRWVVGPLAKPQVYALANTSLSQPVLALNFIDQPIKNDKLYQFALSPQDEAAQVANKANEAGYRRALIIAPATDWGRNTAQAFAQQWQQKNGVIIDSFYYANQASLDPGIKHLLQIKAGANKQAPMAHRQDSDMIFLLADPVTARQINPLLSFYYAGNLPVYATSLVYAGRPNPGLDNDLNGIRFCDMPFILEPQSVQSLQASNLFRQVNPHVTSQSYRLFAFGYDAYHLTLLLPQLSHDPNQGYPGLTGLLYLSNNQQIKRKLVWAEFKNGAPVLI